MLKDKPFNVIKAECPDFYEWLKEISRYSKVENFIQPDYKHGIHVFFYTHNYRYCIKVIPKGEYKETKTNGVVTGASNHPSYLGCTVQQRKPRAGEDWNRGNDLADGKYTRETWEKIKNDIISYELVKPIIAPDTKSIKYK